jgi:hypothetical protein
MTRLMLAAACCLMTFALVASTSAAEPGPDSKQPAEKKPAAEKSEKEKPAAEAKKAEKPAEKAKAAEAKPDAGAKPAVAKPQAKPAAKPASPKPDTVTVKPGLFKLEVRLKGTLEPQTMREIEVRPEAWSTFKVVEAVEHGEEVDRDDVLVEFETEDFDEAIADQRRKIELAEVALKLADANLSRLEETTPMDLASADRSKRHSDEDLEYFLKVDRPMSEKMADFSVHTSENYLEYQKEELRQLEKMYEADDLTEETEEIILKRQRDAVERAEFFLEMDKVQRDETLKTRLPRLTESMKLSNRRETLTLEESKVALKLALDRARLDLDKLKDQLEKEKEKLEDLESDRPLLEIKAPMDGLVYYGKFKDGEWSGAGSGREKLKKGGSVSAKEVFMTVVKPRPLMIRLEVPEKDVAQFRPGLRGTVKPTGYSDLRLPATVTDVGKIPVAAGKFEALLRVGTPEEAAALMPGMACSVKFIPYLKKRTLTIPASAMHTDELDDQKHYVCRLTDDGKVEKQPVTIGKRTEAKVEIVDGLVTGDKVVKEFPKDKR